MSNATFMTHLFLFLDCSTVFLWSLFGHCGVATGSPLGQLSHSLSAVRALNSGLRRPGCKRRVGMTKEFTFRWRCCYCKQDIRPRWAVFPLLARPLHSSLFTLHSPLTTHSYFLDTMWRHGRCTYVCTIVPACMM